jgi:hypothetical protein
VIVLAAKMAAASFQFHMVRPLIEHRIDRMIARCLRLARRFASSAQKSAREKHRVLGGTNQKVLLVCANDLCFCAFEGLALAAGGRFPFQALPKVSSAAALQN